MSETRHATHDYLEGHVAVVPAGRAKSAAQRPSLLPRAGRYDQGLEEAGRTPTGTQAEEGSVWQVLIDRTPLGVPWVEPDDVAPVVVLLASDAARMGHQRNLRRHRRR